VPGTISRTEKMRITGAGNIGIGTNNPSKNLEVFAADSSTELRVINSSSTAQRSPQVNVRNYAGATTGFPSFSLTNFRGNSTTTAAMSSGDRIGSMVFYGAYDTVGSYSAVAQIDAEAEGAGAFSSGDTPGRLIFKTTPDGTGTTVERMRIDNAGNVGIGTTNPATKLDVNGTITATGFSGPLSTSVGTFGLGTVGAPSITFTGDTNTGWWSPAADTLAASTNGVERVRIDSSGKVGVGTSSPTYALESFNGDIALNDNADVARKYWLIRNGSSIGKLSTDNTRLTLQALGNKDVQIADTAGNGLFLKDGGNVGIGTLSPAQLLHVFGNGNSTVSERIENASAGASATAALSLVSDTAGGTIQMFSSGSSVTFGGVSAAGAFAVRSNASPAATSMFVGTSSTQPVYLMTNSTPRMTVDASGNVGIGSTNPVSKLDVNGTITATGFSGPLSTSVGTFGLGTVGAPSITFTGDTNTGWWSPAADTLAASTAGAERMRIDSSGNIGVGTLNPTSKLYISQSSDAAHQGLQLRNAADTASFGIYVDASAKTHLGAPTASPDAIVLDNSTGNIGIGTTAPGNRLTVLETNPATTTAVLHQFSPALTAVQATNMHANWNALTDGTTQNITATMYGSVNRVTFGAASTGTVTGATGLIGDVYNQNTKNITTATGVTGAINNQGAGVIASASGITAGVTNSGTGSVTSATGITINAPNVSSGSIGTFYGLYINNPTAAGTNYALYSAGGTNYFGGNVGIGTTSPSNKLEVLGNAKFINNGSNAVVRSDAYGTGFTGHFIGSLSRGTYAAPTYPQSGDALAAFQGRDSIDWTAYGGMTVLAAENYTAGAKGMHLTFTNTPIGTNAPAERMRIAASGNVGIGTINPATKLDVIGTVTATAFSGPFSGTSASVGAGTVGAPSLSFSGDPNTGFYNASSNDTISVAANATKIFDFTTTGLVSPTTGGALITTGNGTAGAPTFSFAGDAGTGWWRPAASTMAASTGGVERVRIDSTGKVGIGTTAPASPLTVWSSSTVTSGQANYLQQNVDVAPAAASTALVRGILSTSSTSSANVSGATHRGAEGQATNTGTGTLGTAEGLTAYVANTSTGTITTGKGLASLVTNSSTGTIASARGVDIQVSNPGGGTITTGYGVYVGSIAGTSKYSLYASDATAPSYFAGNVGIGTASPLYSVHLMGTVDPAAFAVEGVGAVGPNFIGLRANGTPAAKTGVATNDNLAVLAGRGYTSAGSYQTNPTSFISLRAAESFTGTAQGTYMAFVTAPIGSTTPVERMRVDSSGFVGIGSTVPGAKLDIFSNSTDNVPALAIDGGGDAAGEYPLYVLGRASAFNTDVVHIASNRVSSSAYNLINTVIDEDGTPSYPFVVRGDGKVGIGTTIPVTMLHLNGSDNRAITLSPGTTNQEINFIESDNGNVNARYANITGVLSNGTTGFNYGHIAFSTAPNSAGNPATVERMRIAGDGNVGIGKTNPAAVLHVANPAVAASDTAQFLQPGLPAAATTYLKLGHDTSNYNTADIGFFYNAAGSSSNALRFGFYGFNPILNVQATGNVGIGTLNPVYPLDVAAGGSYAIGLRQKTATNELGMLWVDSTNNIRAELGMVGTAGQIFTASAPLDFGVKALNGNLILGAGSANERMRIDTAGNVGIGTTNAAYKLDVRGGQVAGAGAFVNTSDIRTKKDIEPIAYGLDAVLKLRPVGFNWKDQSQDWAKQHQIGLIAQEAELVIPEIVSTANDPDHMKSIAYGAITPVLIKATQDLYGMCKMSEDQLASLSVRVDQHDREIASLKQENADLREQNAALKEAVCEINPNAKVCQTK
jgi:hypothetical protein